MRGFRGKLVRRGFGEGRVYVGRWGAELSLSGRRVLWKVPFTATEFDWKDCETDAFHRWAWMFISLALQNSVFENEEILKFRQFCATFEINFTKSLSASYHLIKMIGHVINVFNVMTCVFVWVYNICWSNVMSFYRKLAKSSPYYS